LKKEKKVYKKNFLCRPTVPNFFGDVSGNKEFFYALSLSLGLPLPRPRAINSLENGSLSQTQSPHSTTFKPVVSSNHFLLVAHFFVHGVLLYSF